jgi:redox-sensitive bicupin YhaK (pirin superfamily)
MPYGSRHGVLAVSGPVTEDGAPIVGGCDVHAGSVEVLDSSTSTVGTLQVRRALPRRSHRTVGAWCFADHMGPAAVTEEQGVDIGPHPHIGLQTVTWLVAGEILHRDSLGSEQVIRAGQLNLMTAGNGVAHSEEATGQYAGELHGIQLWVAQPESTRHGAAAFEHHAELPQLDVQGATATVIVGDLGGTPSPARHDTGLVGAELAVRPGRAVVPLRATFEHALVVLDGAVRLGRTIVEPGRLAYLGPGPEELPLDADTDTLVMLLGGEPFPDELVMWWNFVGRSRDEIDSARDDWEAAADRFGAVASPLPRIPAPRPQWRGRG